MVLTAFCVVFNEYKYTFHTFDKNHSCFHTNVIVHVVLCMHGSHYVSHSFLAQQGLLSDSSAAEKLTNKKIERKR